MCSTDFFNKGKYDVNRSFYKTMSPSMDILISSNLERLLFELCDREKLKELMQSLDIYGSYEVDKEELREKLPEFVSVFQRRGRRPSRAISNFYDMFGYLLDPHYGGSRFGLL